MAEITTGTVTLRDGTEVPRELIKPITDKLEKLKENDLDGFHTLVMKCHNAQHRISPVSDPDEEQVPKATRAIVLNSIANPEYLGFCIFNLKLQNPLSATDEGKIAEGANSKVIKKWSCEIL